HNEIEDRSVITAEFYRRKRPIVLLERGVDANPGAWARLQEGFSRGVIGGSSDTAEIRADVFLSELNVLREVRNIYGQSIEIGAALRSQLQSLAQDRRAREEVITHPRDVAT